MEIAGQHLSIPRNFLFIHRLPARFEILVVARGSTTARGTAFELEIAGQRLVLHSRIELKVGARYELEKVSPFEFRILSEKKAEPQEEIRREAAPAAAAHDKVGDEAIAYLAISGQLSPSDLLALRVMEDAGLKATASHGKYVFDFEAEIGVRGVFVPHGPRQYMLFVTGALNPVENPELVQTLNELGIGPVRQVSPDVLERIAAGSVDIRT